MTPQILWLVEDRCVIPFLRDEMKNGGGGGIDMEITSGLGQVPKEHPHYFM